MQTSLSGKYKDTFIL